MEFLNKEKREWCDLTRAEKGELLLSFYEGETLEMWVPGDDVWCRFNIDDGPACWDGNIFRKKQKRS